LSYEFATDISAIILIDFLKYVNIPQEKRKLNTHTHTQQTNIIYFRDEKPDADDYAIYNLWTT